MKSNAPGQFLGYAIQLPRALFHLLKSGPNETVCVELLGDVALVSSDGKITTEEDKSSISSYPLTDKSSDLWKTFSNWVEAVKQNEIPTQSRFLIFTNSKGRKGIVDRFNSAYRNTEAKEAIEFAKSKLKNLKDDHESYSFFKNCIENEEIFSSIIQNFELSIGEDKAALKEIRTELIKKLIPESQIDFFLETMGGWVQKVILTKIANKEAPKISFEEYHFHFSKILDRIRKRELIDFTLDEIPEKSTLKEVAGRRPLYVRQLDKLGVDEEEVLEAVSEYMRAKVNRDRWIELELVSIEIAEDFENKLLKFWKNQWTRGAILHKNLSHEEQGRLLLVECKSRNELINNTSPPSPTISGTYHALVDDSTIGWHPEWEKELN